MKISNQTAHFYVNGQSLGPAIMNLPSVSYWAVIDMYGQCVQVKIAPREMERSRSIDRRIPLAFHSRCGSYVHITNDRRSASRHQACDEFNNGVVFSNRPLNGNELFEVVIVKKLKKWSGSLEIGVTGHKPETLEIPSSLTNFREATWVLGGDGVVRDVDGASSDVYTDKVLDRLPEMSRVGVMKKRNGDLHFFINGNDQGLAARRVPSNVYAVIDIYGQTAEVKLSEATGKMIGQPVASVVNSSVLLDELLVIL